MLRNRMTPVVVSSVPPMTPATNSCRLLRMAVTRSAPSSMVIWGLWSSADDDMRIVRVFIFTLDGKDGNVEILHQGGRHIILGAQRVRGANHDVCAAVPQCNGQVCGFRGHMKAGSNSNPFERTFGDEPLPDEV